MNANRTRAILAAQKLKQEATPQPLTRDERKAIYAPRPSSSAPQHLQAPEWVRVWRATTRATYGVTAIFTMLFGGIILGESKKGIK